MALKLVRKKKVKPAAAGRRTTSEIEKFRNAVDVQLRLASGEQVKKGRGLAKSWMVDGTEYGVAKVLVPRVGNIPLYPKSALIVDMKQKKPPTKELKELAGLAADGKLSNRIYATLRKQRKGEDLVDTLKKRGFKLGLRMEQNGPTKFRVVPENACDLPGPLVYVVVDRNGESVRTGRALAQSICQREGSTEKGLNGLSTVGQNNKTVIKNLRRAIKETGPLYSYVKQYADRDSAKKAEIEMFDLFRGRYDNRRG